MPMNNVPGPSAAEINDAAKKIVAAANASGNKKIQVTRGDHSDPMEREWIINNEAAEQLEARGIGTMENRSFESFEFHLS